MLSPFTGSFVCGVTYTHIAITYLLTKYMYLHHRVKLTYTSIYCTLEYRLDLAIVV